MVETSREHPGHTGSVAVPVNHTKVKRWKKTLLILLIPLLFSQVPFAYRRYKLGRLHAAIQQLNLERVVTLDDDGLAEFKGVVHVHSFLGGHSSGSFTEIISAAQANKLDFVIMTEHPAKDFNSAEMTLKGEHGGVLFINGNEVRTAGGDRLLLIPGDIATSYEGQTQQVLSRRNSGLALVAYPDEFKSWAATGYNGIEVYNVYTDARQINPIVMFFDALWSYGSYPDLLFANFYQKPVFSLNKWDDLIKGNGKRLVATAGNDAHANVGISLIDSSGKTLLGLQLDPYDRSFRLVRLHVLAMDGSRSNGHVGLPFPADKALLEAIGAGHCFIGIDLFGDTSGFRFSAHQGGENWIMGDEIKLRDKVTLKVNVPLPARIVMLKDGVQIQEVNGVNRTEFDAREKGSYRVEVYLSQLPKPAGEQPWIISNPIYLR